jgi:2-C-methyl-D-erythritol 4-phosphate cytidylyltransferase
VPEPVIAVVVAAGYGVRFGGPTPKPALRLAGRSVLALALDNLAAGGVNHIIIVSRDQSLFQSARRASPTPSTLAPGGESRQESVRSGLAMVADSPTLARARVILVHDAARPLQPPDVTRGVIAAVRAGAVAVAPALPVVDTIRLDTGAGQTRVVDRDLLHAVQTPQGFDPAVIIECHRRAALEPDLTFTDDVTCCEHYGHPVTLVPGSRLGLKITEQADLTVARALWREARR